VSRTSGRARARVVEMLEALRLYDILAIMATEGVEAAMTLEADMFPDNGGAPWALEANRIHGADRIIRFSRRPSRWI
jgi:hypothetical protein